MGRGEKRGGGGTFAAVFAMSERNGYVLFFRGVKTTSSFSRHSADRVAAFSIPEHSSLTSVGEEAFSSTKRDKKPPKQGKGTLKKLRS